MQDWEKREIRDEIAHKERDECKVKGNDFKIPLRENQALDHLYRWTHRNSALHFHDSLCFHIGEKYPSEAHNRRRIRYLRWVLARLAETTPHPKANLAKHLLGAGLDVATHPQARLLSLVLPGSGVKLTARERNL